MLDVGCGVGGNAMKLASLGYSVTGICPDPYQEMLFRENTKGKAGFALTTLEGYKTGEIFDLVLMSESVQYIPHEDGLKKVTKLLKSKGYLLISDYFKKDNAKDVPNLPSFLISDYMAAAERYGFKMVKRQEITMSITPTLEYGTRVYLDYIKPVLSCILTTMQVHLPPVYWIFNIFMRLRVKGKTLKQTIVNNLVPLDRGVFEKYLTYQVILFQKK